MSDALLCDLHKQTAAVDIAQHKATQMTCALRRKSRDSSERPQPSCTDNGTRRTEDGLKFTLSNFNKRASDPKGAMNTDQTTP